MKSKLDSDYEFEQEKRKMHKRSKMLRKARQNKHNQWDDEKSPKERSHRSDYDW